MLRGGKPTKHDDFSLNPEHPPLAKMVAAFMASGLDIGERHILPTFSFRLVLAAGGAWAVQSALGLGGRGAAAGACGQLRAFVSQLAALCQ